jgi:hypothetical protein
MIMAAPVATTTWRPIAIRRPHTRSREPELAIWTLLAGALIPHRAADDGRRGESARHLLARQRNPPSSCDIFAGIAE